MTDGAVELRENNAYIIDHGTKQWTISHEGRLFANIDPLSKEGALIHENYYNAISHFNLQLYF